MDVVFRILAPIVFARAEAQLQHLIPCIHTAYSIISTHFSYCFRLSPKSHPRLRPVSPNCHGEGILHGTSLSDVFHTTSCYSCILTEP